MKTYNKRKLKKIKPSNGFNYIHKCKVCDTKFLSKYKENMVVKEGRFKTKIEYKTEKVGVFFDLFSRDQEYYRYHYEIVNIYYVVCPNCGHEKALFYSSTDRVETSDWMEEIDCHGYY